MMHEPEKSDLAIVAVKPANKVEQPAPERLAVCVPAPVTRSPDSASGTCFAGPHFPWSPPFAPPAPPLSASLQIARERAVPLCSQASQLLWRGPTSRVRASSATVPHLPDADRIRQRRSSRTRDLPGSDAILLHVMWPLTPAGRQHLACRCRTCCLRANENPRPLRCLIFRGSIPHPMQLLCTLRDHCRQGPRNTRYQADATPYLGRTSTGWIAPALPGALIRSPRRRGRAVKAEQ